MLTTSGKVSGADLAAVRAADFDDGEIVEIVAAVVLGCFTNFINNTADTELDVPRVAAVACSTSIPKATTNCCSIH